MRPLSISHLHSPDMAVQHYLCCGGRPECRPHGVSCKQPHKSHGLHFWVSRSCTIRSPCLQHCSINSVWLC